MAMVGRTVGTKGEISIGRSWNLCLLQKGVGKEGPARSCQSQFGAGQKESGG